MDKPISPISLESFWEEHCDEINKVISQVYRLKKPSMDFLNMDYDEYESLANLILATNLQSVFDNSGVTSEDTVFGLIKCILMRKTDTYIRGQNCHKRKANIQTKSLQEPINSYDDEGLTVEDILVGDEGADKPYAKDNSNSGIYRYLKTLSDKQKSIVILKLLDFSNDDIMTCMGLSRKEFNSLMNSMRMIEKKQLIFQKKGASV